MQVADLNRKRKRRKNRTGNRRRSEKDPLQSFNGGDVNLDSLGDGDDQNEMPDFDQEDGDYTGKRQKREGSSAEKKIFTSTSDGTGKSTAGRNAWKEKHRKGKFSKKMRMSERRKKDPLGI